MRSKKARPIALGAAMAMTLAIALSACGEDGGDGKAADGKPAGTVKVLAVEGPETDALEEGAKAFTKESGIAVTVDKVARDLWSQRKVAELAQDAGTYDVVFVGGGDDSQWLLEHAHVQDLAPHLGDDVVNDIVNHELFTRDDGSFVGAPQYLNFPMLFYRADLFGDPGEQKVFKDKYGRDLAVPTTFDELVEVAEFFHRPPELYGTCIGGVDWSVFIDDTYFTYGQDSNFGDLDTGELTLNSPEHIKSLQYIKDLTAFNAPGWETQSFFDCDNQVQAGTVALYQNWLYAWDVLKEPMGDKIAMAPPPGAKTHLGAMLATIPEAAPNPEGAGEFIAWMLTDAYQLDQTEATGNLPVRLSQLDSADFAEALDQIGMLKDVAQRLTYQFTTWSGELSTGVAEAIAKVYQGEMTPTEAANWLQNDKFAGRKALE
ncbi:MAG: extracellular solute-binding protein [Bifidobacteriaceae bacterium]|jgi:ABC-type glycerol-3-phosphate transport system substrate-binding protein|nr:extracellular solute-binding protein [Bifidobacteriaceae bacterium]